MDFFSQKRGQASLEFLSVYAWALVVILVSVGAMYYFGVFDFGSLQNNECKFNTQIECLDFAVTESEIRVKLYNGIGRTVEVESVDVLTTEGNSVNCDSISFTFNAETTYDLILTGCTLPGKRVNAFLNLTYYSLETPSQPRHTIMGRISAKKSYLAADPQCRDGIDNDADGNVDYPADTGCFSADDVSENNESIACDDGIDNDGDGTIDMLDAGCSGPTDYDESNCGDLVCTGSETCISCIGDCGACVACNDGVDNDGDSLIDLADSGCSISTDTSELGTLQCDDGIDNDGDGNIDLVDTGCSSPSENDESNCGDLVCEGSETCNNCAGDCGVCAICEDLIDNDGDGNTDFPADAGCTSASDMSETNCGDLVCTGNETCASCAGDCGVCDAFLYLNGSITAMAFAENGDAILAGTLTESTTPTPSGNDELIFQNAIGSTVALIDLDIGDMTILGSLFENQTSLTPPSETFIIQNSSDEVISYIDGSGNFYLKGFLTQNGNP